MEAMKRIWNNRRAKDTTIQVIFLVIVLAAIAFIVNNVIVGMNRLGMSLDFSFLSRTASFDISGDKLISYSATDSYARAILVGILNTLRVAFIGIILATILGTIIGIARLSKNWLARTIAKVYVEIFRNTPLLVQMIIWYSAVFLTLPLIESEVNIGQAFFFSNRGVAIPWVDDATTATWIWGAVLLIGFIVGILIYRFKLKQQMALGQNKRPYLWFISAILIAGIASFLITMQGPFQLSIPAINENGRSYVGGFILSPSFGAILIALVMYTAAFIAEIVRAGILGVNKGQREAAYSLGLKESTALRLVIFPQAYRIIIPPMTNQYLNLTKNSSLGVAVGYPEIVTIGNITLSQSGRAVQMIIVMIACYLLFSILTSIFMNLFNKFTQLKER
ncbi:amino acid ABC transporter permease [Shouchella lehensis]|uniref:Amino acid ABC transporter, permease protein n=1 Tax=Shouchella lehensis G1 TaxID=1246626 RepID=A0A060LTG1_9BACI|nr:ABC transporter permease subunit [Shouchella lehensis]AIC93280.1 amino acid ABC transporter, permease protein [Shouchella lehensis G1]RQW22835.1 ABC transporter permease subunit [Bacillus sp. C1-1]